METRSQAKAKLKRQRDDNDSDQRKSQRRVPSADPEHKTQIIDLNDDCLIKVFGYLNLRSLFNVAFANKWLRPAARDVYTRKFGMKMVEISGCEFRSKKGKYSAPREYGGDVHIYDLKTSLQFLRCFGSSVGNLTIDYNRSTSKRYEYVHQYINEYCATNLVRIGFRSMPIFEAEPFTKVFVNVKELEVWVTVLEQNLQSFAKWFPNVCRLDLRHNQCCERFTADLFHHLEHLKVFGLHGGNQNGFVADLLRGAHRLKTINIKIFGDKEFPIETLLDMIKDKPMLTELLYDSSKMQEHRPMPVDLAAAQQIINDHPGLVDLDLPQFQFTRAGIDALIGQLNSLKELRFVMRHDDFYNLFFELQNEWHSSSYGFKYLGDDDAITLGSFIRIEQ